MRLKQAVLASCFCAAVSGQGGIPSRMTIQKVPISQCGMSSNAQTAQRGAEVRAVHFAPDNKSVTVDIVNSSSKGISAYGVSYDITFADGHHEKGERLVEYLQSIISSQQRLGSQWSGEGVFHSGESRKELFEFSQGNAVSTMNATVDVIIYMDQTADVGNDDAFRMFVTDRGATAKAAEKAAAILQTALADQTDLHPLKTASTQLQQMMVKEPTESLPARADIEGLIRNLAAIQASGRSDERESMKACLAEKNQQKVMTWQHAQIRRQK